jgi:peroxiredoxin
VQFRRAFGVCAEWLADSNRGIFDREIVRERSNGSIFWVAAAILAGVFLFRDKDLNRPAPDFALHDAYGSTISSDLYRGRPALLVFWATWCGVCRAELPIVNRMAPEFQRRGIAVVAIHVGESGDISEYLRTNQIDVTTALDPDGAVGQAYRVSGIPKLVLIGADGKIKRSAAGMTGEGTLEGWMRAVGSS